MIFPGKQCQQHIFLNSRWECRGRFFKIFGEPGTIHKTVRNQKMHLSPIVNSHNTWSKFPFLTLCPCCFCPLGLYTRLLNDEHSAKEGQGTCELNFLTPGPSYVVLTMLQLNNGNNFRSFVPKVSTS